MPSTQSRYREVYAGWQSDPVGFWEAAARDIDWIRPADKVFDSQAGVYGRWFVGAECNTCYNAVDRHVATRGDQAAIIYDSPVTNTKRSITYAELQDEVATLAAVLQEMGVVKGDRVVIYMPMIPETSFAMLACARIGAIHSVVFGGFAAKELATRIDDAKPKVILSASCGVEGARVIPYKPLLDEAITLSTSKPEACLVFQRPQLACALNDGRDRDWTSAVDAARAEGRKAECVPVAATDPLYVLYTSGTTGVPKGVVRDNGGHMVALKWSMGHFFGVKPGEVFWAASDVGWVVGHSYIVYGPLLHGCTAVLYEGKPVGTPDAGAYWRVIADHGVVTLFTAPTAFRAIKKEDPKAELLKTYDLSSFRALFLAGERADPDTVKWAEDILRVPVIDHWWQTETGWPVAGNPLGLGALPVKHGSPTVPMPGYTLEVLDEGGKPVAPNTMGAIVIKLPLPPGGAADPLAGGQAVQGILSLGLSRLLQHLGCRLSRRGRLYLGDGPHRRHHQRRRPPSLDRRHGGGAGLPSGGRGMRRDRREGFAQGRGAVRLRGAEIRHRPAAGRGRGGTRGPGARQDRARGRLQAGDHRGAPAQDPVRQDPARHHEEDRRWRCVVDARHHRRSDGPERDRRCAAGEGACRMTRPSEATGAQPTDVEARLERAHVTAGSTRRTSRRGSKLCRTQLKDDDENRR